MIVTQYSPHMWLFLVCQWIITVNECIGNVTLVYLIDMFNHI